MLIYDVHTQSFLDASTHTEAELITRIAGEILAGNYTNSSRLINTFDSPSFKRNIQTKHILQQCINAISAQCKQNSSFAL
ncbi:hypothetical protein [Legionella gresilensis]|uniref:hypothetical protein n=1 Tax=Legionella gresilensis TaxID=91823 RepID=UPI001040E99C|nr:hypothetical protein [Legionella gresilensis]